MFIKWIEMKIDQIVRKRVKRINKLTGGFQKSLGRLLGIGDNHENRINVLEKYVANYIERNDILATFRTMPLCPDCGNKRCPKAENPDAECANSNDLHIIWKHEGTGLTCLLPPGEMPSQIWEKIEEPDDD